MSLKHLYLIENVDNDLICLLMITKIICWCWLTVGSWIMFVVFSIKPFVDLSTFALKSEHVRFLQDFIVWPKCLESETTKTETVQTKSARPKSRIPRPGRDSKMRYSHLNHNHKWKDHTGCDVIMLTAKTALYRTVVSLSGRTFSNFDIFKKVEVLLLLITLQAECFTSSTSG